MMEEKVSKEAAVSTAVSTGQAGQGTATITTTTATTYLTSSVSTTTLRRIYGLSKKTIKNQAGAQKPGAVAVPGCNATKAPHKPRNGSSKKAEGSTEEEGNRSGPIVLEGTLAEDAKWWQRKWIVVAAAVVLVLTSLVIVIPLAVLKTEPSEDAPLGELDQTQSRDQDTIDVALIPGMTQATIIAIEGDRFSPQFQAYDWVSKDPNWDTYEDWRKQQRFALACVFNAMYSAYSKYAAFNYYSNECDWIKNGGRPLCNDQGEVTIFDIHHKGTRPLEFVPPQIGYLSGLKRFALDKAQLDTTLEDFLPKETLESFPAIQELSFGGAGLKGSIPSTLGLLTSLTSLNLQGKIQVVFIQSEWQRLVTRQNHLSSSIPSELGLLSNLRHLYLSGNQLSGHIPEELGGLSFLTTLEVQDNPELEPPLPAAFCANNSSAALESLQIDWCESLRDCCQ